MVKIASFFTWEGTNELPKDGFDFITVKVIFQGLTGQKKVKFWYFAKFWQFSQTAR